MLELVLDMSALALLLALSCWALGPIAAEINRHAHAGEEPVRTFEERKELVP